MRLTRLRLRDFLPFDELDLDFDGLGQLAIVGANGAGKSSLLDAVLWSIYGQARGRPDQLVREGADRSMVETSWIHADLGPVVIRRTRDTAGAQSTLTLHVDGANKTRHTIADTQSAIEDVIGLPYRALLAGPVMVQGESDALMATGPAERKEILVKLFELDRYELFHNRAKAKALEATGLREAARQTVARLQDVVDEELSVRSLRRDATEAIVRARLEVDTEDTKVVELRAVAVAMRERATRAGELLASLATANTQLDRSTSTLAELDEQVMEHRHIAGQDVAAVDAEVFDRLDELEVVTREFLSSSDKVDLIESVPCGGVGQFASCRFLVDATVTAGRVPELEARILALGGPAPIDEIAAERKKLRLLDRASERAGERKAQAELWLKKEPVVRQSLEEQIALAKKSVRQTKKSLVELEDDIARTEQVTADLSAAVAALQLAQGTLEVNLATLAGAEGRLKVIDKAKSDVAVARLDEARNDVEVVTYQTLMRAFGRDGIPTLILENGIPLIEERANEVLARMPGGFAVRLVTQRDTKAGTTRETLDIEVIVDGRERAYSLLSGGERLRVDFAVRVALSDVLVRRKGRAFESLWLDETFSSQDKDGREAMLQAIAAVASDFSLIVCVSHIDEITERFETRLVVEKDHATGISSAEIVG